MLTRQKQSRIVLPYMGSTTDRSEQGIYMAFVRAFRDMPQRRMETRILTAILHAADATDNSDAYVARVLVGMGLMAPRLAFPGDFLDHVDAVMRKGGQEQHTTPFYKSLATHWEEIGEETLFLSPYGQESRDFFATA